MLAGLQAIVEKQVVLSTVNADDLLHDPEKTEAEYLKHVATFVPMGDVADYSDKLETRIQGTKTPKGMIVAPYGYGKTSTLAFLWNECEKKGVVAVPPFYCASLPDILGATYGWVRFRLGQREPGLLEDLEQIYKKYTAATLEEMAFRYAKEEGIATGTASNLLKAMQKDGSLVLELTPSNLLFFLDSVSSLVTRAGYSGLLVLPDEFQQYFSKGANLRRSIQEFREFIWGLDTRSNALGVIISVPTYAESIIQEQGKDILARLKKDNLYFQLQDIYSVDFPERLWTRFATIFKLGDTAAQVLDPETLKAIGQIAEREDLGEGPRTVIDSFKRAILHFQDSGTPYSPINLMDDFLESNINFQAQTNKLKTVTRQALDSGIVNTSDRKEAIKLLAAFPRGCSTTIQRKYGLYSTVNTLSKAVHGELMTHLVEGYTLLGLSRTGGPTHTVDIIITRFWQNYEEDDFHHEAAIRAFNNHLLNRFFEQRRGTAATGWGKLDFASTPRGSYVSLIEGTFNPKYPHRILNLQTAYNEKQLMERQSEADLQFDFLFRSLGHDHPGKMSVPESRLVCYELNVQKKLGPGLPEDLRKLQEFVNPEFVTPLLMLGLVDYFNSWEEISDQPIPESDNAEIAFFTGRIIEHTISLLFNREMTASISPPIRRVGRFMLEEAFNRRCNDLFENYNTLYVQAQHEKVINDYLNAMRDMTLKERRGHANVQGPKSALARRFGLNSVATFDNRIDSEYKNFIEKVEWTGRGDDSKGVLLLTLHPLEREILNLLHESEEERQIDGIVVPILSANNIADIARGYGYRDEEIMKVLELLAARGYARFDEREKIIYLSQVGPEPDELWALLTRVSDDIEQLTSLIDPQVHNEFTQKVEKIKSNFAVAASDEEELNELETFINDLATELSDAIEYRRNELLRELNNLIGDLERQSMNLRQTSVLEREIQGQVTFVMHLNELRQTLRDRQNKLRIRVTNQITTLKNIMERSGSDLVNECKLLVESLKNGRQEAVALHEQENDLDTNVGYLEQWIRLLKETDNLFNALSRSEDLRIKLTQEVIPSIQIHLTKQKIEGLADYEIFKDKVSAIEEELDSRRRHGNEIFGRAKEKYESILRVAEVREYRPATRYTFGEDEGSYQDLHEEVRKKIESRLQEIEEGLSREQSDLLQAKYINIVSNENRPIVDRVESELHEARDELKDLQRVLTPALIKASGENLEEYCQRIREVAKAFEKVRLQLGPILFADHELADDEIVVYQALGSKSDVDLTDLFVALHIENPTLSLRQLLEHMETLYRKRRVSIRIRSRG